MLLAKSRLTLCNLMDCSPARPWNSLGKNTGVGSHSLLQGIFPTQGSNPGLPHCRWSFTNWAISEVHSTLYYKIKIKSRHASGICRESTLCYTSVSSRNNANHAHNFTFSSELWIFLVAQLVKNPPAMRETWVWSLGWEDSLEKGQGYPLQ